MSTAESHVVFAGGISGGHLFPGLAVADELDRLDGNLRITFAGTGANFEREHVARAGFDYVASILRPPSRSPWSAVRFVMNQWSGMRGATRFLRQKNVSLVVGLGAYASLPMARAAAAARLPLVLLEQNAVAGRATTWLSPSATLVCSAFDGIEQQLRASCPVRVTGNPIRRHVGTAAMAAAANHVPPRPKRLVVLGGTRGARMLNEQVPRALYKLGDRLRGWEILHQTGNVDVDATRLLYRKFALPAKVVSFLHDAHVELCRTRLALCRAGGTTISELAAAGVPAVLVPYPHAANDHQRQNAEVLAKAGAATIVDSREVEGRLDNRLADALAPLISDQQKWGEMSVAMRQHARPDAARQVASMIRDLLPQGRYRAAG